MAAIDPAVRPGRTVEPSGDGLGLERSRDYRWKGGRSLEQIGSADGADRPPGPRPGAGVQRLWDVEKERLRPAAPAERYADWPQRKLCHPLSRDAGVHGSAIRVSRLRKAEGGTGPARAVRPQRPGAELVATRPNQRWGGDVSYLRVSETFMDWIAIIAAYWRTIVGQALSYEPNVAALPRVWDGARSRAGLRDP